MTLFETDSLYREKAVIWRIFSLLPLCAPLAGGSIWKWFAINIPMDLGTGVGGTFTSDIDILACLSDFPRSRDTVYKTWEVKVSLLCKDGSARSLKAGKTKRTLTQLNAYRNYGAPSVTLLQVYLSESGFMGSHQFPTPAVHEIIISKIVSLYQERFGYQLLPFEHGRDEDGDVGLFAMPNPRAVLRTTIDLLIAPQEVPKDPFLRLTNRLNEFFQSVGDRPHKHRLQITFCRACRSLQLVDMKSEFHCPSCKDDLIMQS